MTDTISLNYLSDLMKYADSVLHEKAAPVQNEYTIVLPSGAFDEFKEGFPEHEKDGVIRIESKLFVDTCEFAIDKFFARNIFNRKYITIHKDRRYGEI